MDILKSSAIRGSAEKRHHYSLLQPAASSHLQPNQMENASVIGSVSDWESSIEIKIEADGDDANIENKVLPTERDISPSSSSKSSNIGHTHFQDMTTLENLSENTDPTYYINITENTSPTYYVPKKSFPCNICGRSFNRLSHMQRHQRQHTGEKPYECEICSHRFSRLENRTRHMSVHTGERAFECKICNKGFSQRNRLEAHVQLHNEKPYICLVCGKNFARINDRNIHMEIHQANMNVLATAPPSKVTYQRPSVNNELITKVLKKSYKCPTCAKSFARKDHLDRHCLSHTGNKTFECNICAKLFSRQDNQYDHMARCIYKIFGINVEKPSSDNANETLEEKVNAHLMDIQSGKLIPQQTIKTESLSSDKNDSSDLMSLEPVSGETSNDATPNVEFASKIKIRPLNELTTGGSDHDNNIPRASKTNSTFGDYKCKMCPQTFLYKKQLVKHILSHAATKPFMCEKCDKGFYRKDHLDRHSLIHADTKPYKCNFCDQTFDSVQEQIIHFVGHSKNDSPGATTPVAIISCAKTFKCYYCDELFYSRAQMQLHHSMHTDEKSYRCDICKRGFKRLEHVKRHQAAIHTKEKRYECDFCEKKFYRADQKLLHTKTHDGVLPYKCSRCDERFSTSKEKIQHLRVHYGAYRCELCPTRFELFVDLNEHKVTMHNEMPSEKIKAKRQIKTTKDALYKCPVCSEKFTIVMLRDHLSVHIPSDTDDRSSVSMDGISEMDFDESNDIDTLMAQVGGDLKNVDYDIESDTSERATVDVDGSIEIKVEPYDEYEESNAQIILEHNYC